MRSSIPEFEGPIPGSDIVASAAAGLAGHGYSEQEFFISGAASVYGPRNPDRRTTPWRRCAFAHHELDYGALARSDVPYATRVLVRAPTDPARFNGVVYFEPLHVHGDTGFVGWNMSHEWIMRTGGAWVGVTASAGVSHNGHPIGGLSYLQASNPQRYGRLRLDEGEASQWPLLNTPDGPVDMAAVMAAVDWTGTNYSEAFARICQRCFASYAHSPDVMIQLGRLLKTGGPAALLGGAVVRRIYVTGGSLTGYYWNMFLQGGRHAHCDDGRPVFDAYVVMVCEPSPGLEFPSDAPVIHIESEREAARKTGLSPPADSDSPRRRYYEIAGTGHRFTGSDPERIADDWERAGLSAEAKAAASVPGHITHNTRPNAPLLHALWSHLDQWVETGAPMPSAPRIARDPSTVDGVARDADGNAIDGLRGPWITVPDARYLTACPAHPNDGAMELFTAEQRQARGLTRAIFLDRIEARVAQLVAERWILPEDARVYRDHAERVSAGW
jgi:hypothetical protein